jgi:hypothetical protein
MWISEVLRVTRINKFPEILFAPEHCHVVDTATSPYADGRLKSWLEPAFQTFRLTN